MHQPQLKKKNPTTTTTRSTTLHIKMHTPEQTLQKLKKEVSYTLHWLALLHPRVADYAPPKIGAGGMGKFSVMAFLIDN